MITFIINHKGFESKFKENKNFILGRVKIYNDNHDERINIIFRTDNWGRNVVNNKMILSLPETGMPDNDDFYEIIHLADERFNLSKGNEELLNKVREKYKDDN